MIKNLTQLKKQATNYTWELYSRSFDGGKTQSSQRHGIGKVRNVLRVSSTDFIFENPEGEESYLSFPKAKECTFESYLYNDTDTIFTINLGKTQVKYHLRPIV